MRRTRMFATALLAATALLLAPAAAVATPVSPNIIGGEEADIAYPFIASLQTLDGAHKCGGVLIRPQFVLTAPYCVFGYDATTIRVRVGSNSKTTGGEVRVGSEVRTSASYLDGYGVGLLKLDAPIDNLEPVELYDDRLVGLNLPTRILGWGIHLECGIPCLNVPDALQQMSTMVMNGSPERCPGMNRQLELCVAARPGYTPCYGDGGGPALMWRPEYGRWQLAGVLGRGPRTCGDGYYYFANAPAFAAFIDAWTA